jgi:hypothetical protein
MGLLDGGLAQIFYGAFNGIFLDATLHRSTITDNGKGGGTETWTNEPVKASLDAMTEAMRQQEGYVDTDQRILVLAHGIEAPNADCEITVKGRRWMIASVGTDPAEAAYELRGRLAGDA